MNGTLAEFNQRFNLSVGQSSGVFTPASNNVSSSGSSKTRSRMRSQKELDGYLQSAQGGLQSLVTAGYYDYFADVSKDEDKKDYLTRFYASYDKANDKDLKNALSYEQEELEYATKRIALMTSIRDQIGGSRLSTLNSLTDKDKRKFYSDAALALQYRLQEEDKFAFEQGKPTLIRDTIAESILNMSSEQMDSYKKIYARNEDGTYVKESGSFKLQSLREALELKEGQKPTREDVNKFLNTYMNPSKGIHGSIADMVLDNLNKTTKLAHTKVKDLKEKQEEYDPEWSDLLWDTGKKTLPWIAGFGLLSLTKAGGVIGGNLAAVAGSKALVAAGAFLGPLAVGAGAVAVGVYAIDGVFSVFDGRGFENSTVAKHAETVGGWIKDGLEWFTS